LNDSPTPAVFQIKLRKQRSGTIGMTKILVYSDNQLVVACWSFFKRLPKIHAKIFEHRRLAAFVSF
jgi:hypothetical protein